MENLKKIVSNQYFPAAAVLTVVVLFWTIAMFGGLSLLHNNQPPMATLTWMLFVYGAAVLTPLAGVIAAADLIRRWRRNRQYAQDELADYEWANDELPDEVTGTEPADQQATPEAPGQAAPEAPRQSAAPQPAQQQPAPPQPAQQQAAPPQPAPQQPAKKQRTEPKQRKTAA